MCRGWSCIGVGCVTSVKTQHQNSSLFSSVNMPLTHAMLCKSHCHAVWRFPTNPVKFTGRRKSLLIGTCSEIMIIPRRELWYGRRNGRMVVRRELWYGRRNGRMVVRSLGWGLGCEWSRMPYSDPSIIDQRWRHRRTATRRLHYLPNTRNTQRGLLHGEEKPRRRGREQSTLQPSSSALQVNSL